MRISSEFRCVLGTCRLAVLAGAFLLSGCSVPDAYRGGGFRDADANWGEGLRSPDPAGQASGITAKGRQIERNLGIQ